MRLSAMVGTVLMFFTWWTGATQAAPLPVKDSSSFFPITQSLGYSDGTLYLFTGNTIYAVDLSNEADPQFNPVLTNLESSFTSPPTTRAFEGAFATAPGGKAMVSFGFSDGGVLAVDLLGLTTAEVTDFDAENIFSLAGHSGGTFFAMRVASDFSTSTELHHVDGALSTSFMTDPASGSGYASGGLAFDASGNLFISAFDFTTGPFPSGTAHFYRIDAADVAAFIASSTTPTVTELGTGLTNGNAQIVVGSDGNIYFNTSTGIGVFDVATAAVSNLLGDINDPNLFLYGNAQPFGGLTFDSVNQRLVFARYNSDDGNYYLDFFSLSQVIPEPVSAAALALGVMMLWKPRRGLVP